MHTAYRQKNAWLFIPYNYILAIIVILVATGSYIIIGAGLCDYQIANVLEYQLPYKRQWLCRAHASHGVASYPCIVLCSGDYRNFSNQLMLSMTL